MTESEQAGAVPDLDPWAPIVANIGKLAIVGIIVVNVLNAYAIVAGPFEAGRRWYLLNQESNLSTWLSIMLLVGAGLLAGVCAVVDEPRRRVFWCVGMAALVAMSADEAATIHERVGGLVDTDAGDGADLTYLWVIPWGILALVVAVVLWRLRPRLPVDVRWWLIFGATTCVGAAVALEVVATKTVNSGGTVTEKLSLYSVEETLEMVGALIVGWTLARHAVHTSRERRASAVDGR